jgi:ribosomal protein L40E
LTCPHCHAATAPADKFCRECGTRLLPPTAAEKRREALRQARAVAREGGKALGQGAKLAKKGLETQRGRSVAACAAIGAAAGAVVPVLGPAVGATLGAAAGFMRKL